MGTLATLAGSVRLRRREAFPVPATPTSHPLRVGDIFAGSGLSMLRAQDADITTACPTCHASQTLAEARIEPATRPGDITAYRCVNGCVVLAATGHAARSKAGNGWRFQVGDYVIAAYVPAGLQFLTRSPNIEQAELPDAAANAAVDAAAGAAVVAEAEAITESAADPAGVTDACAPSRFEVAGMVVGDLPTVGDLSEPVADTLLEAIEPDAAE